MDEKLQSEPQDIIKPSDLIVDAPSAEEIDAVLRKYDKASDFRVFSGKSLTLLTFLLFAFSCFQLATATVINFDAMILRALHLGFGLFLIYVYYPMFSKWSRNKLHPVDLFLGAVALSGCLYLVINYRAIVLRAGLVNETDFIVGVIMVFLTLEAARRVIGWPMVIIALVFIMYAF